MRKIKSLFFPFFVLLILALMTELFFFSWHYDNKYTHSSAQAIGGVLFLDSSDLTESSFLYLIHGWNYYADVLLTPETVQDTPVTETVFIGQYSGMERDRAHVSPHGMATYQMSLILPEETHQYALSIPEIFSAYRLYINDTLMVSRGIPEKNRYTPSVKTELLFFEASGKTDLLFAVSDYSYFYSGMIYPPLFGKPSAVIKIQNTHMIFCFLFFGIALCLGIFYLCIGFSFSMKQNLLPFLFSFICLCSAFLILYPLFHSIIATKIQPWYMLEHALRSLLPLLVCLLSGTLCGISQKKNLIVTLTGGIFCIIAVLGNCLSPLLNTTGLQFFSFANLIYQWSCSLWILGLILITLYTQKNFSRPIFCASLIFSYSLILELLFPLFEPIRFGWFSELSAVLLVIILGVVLWFDVVTSYQSNIRLKAEKKQMDIQIELQQKHYNSLSSQIEEIRRFRHDNRHHMEVMNQLLHSQRFEELSEYLNNLTESSASFYAPLSFCPHYALDALFSYYYDKAKAQGITVTFKIQLPEKLQANPADLCVIFGNLLENAFEASQKLPVEDREIFLSVRTANHMLMVELKNAYDGSSLHADGEFFLSTKRKNRHGIGLNSVQAVASKYHGCLAVKQEIDGDKFWFITQLFLGQI